MTKKLLALTGTLLLLAACAPTETDNAMMDDASDDTMMMEDDKMMEKEDDAMMMEDDGMVNGSTTEDAGGDGTNTTGGDSRPQDNRGESRVIRVTAESWAFTPNTITAKKGEDVTIEIEGLSGTHGFAVPDLGINVEVSAGEMLSVDLPTDTVGTFGGFCSVPCGQGHGDMEITVIITE